MGLDAQIAMQFHTSRENNPNFFKSRTINKGVYGVFGMQKFIDASPELRKFGLEISHDGEPIPQENFNKLQCLIWQNIPSYSGGVILWSTPNSKSSYAACDINDNIVEVVGLRHIRHVLGLQAKIQHGKKVCQGSKFNLTNSSPCPIQVC